MNPERTRDHKTERSAQEIKEIKISNIICCMEVEQPEINFIENLLRNSEDRISNKMVEGNIVGDWKISIEVTENLDK